MIAVVTGIRDLARECEPDVELAVIDALASIGATELRVGGARGADTVALAAVCSGLPSLRRVVFLPFARSAPREAQAVIRRCANQVVDLGLARRPESFLARNVAMLEGRAEGRETWTNLPREGFPPADYVIAVTDGRTTGGTAFTMRIARVMGLAVHVIPARARCGPHGAVGYDLRVGALASGPPKPVET